MNRLHICLLLLISSPILLNAQFDDCLAGWLYYKEIQIDNSVNTENLEDFQFKFTLNTGDLVSEGKLQSDGADLRFVTSDCGLLHYYMDSTATSTENVVWLKMPALGASEQMTIRMYYGNANAEAYANGDSTFLFFDDFEAPEVNTDKWETVGEFATFQITDGALDYSSTSANPGPRFKFARTKASWSGGVDLDFRIETGTSSPFGLSSADSLIERYYFRYQNGSAANDTLNLIAIIGDTLSNGYATEVNYPLLNITKNVFQDVSFRPFVDENNKLFLERFSNVETGQVNDEVKDLGPFEMTGFHFVISSFSANQHVLLDEFRVRKILDTMPTTSIGSEENNPATVSTSFLNFDGTFELSPNPAKDFLTVQYEGEYTVRIEIYSMEGRLIYQEVLGAGALSKTLSPQNWNAGSYIARLMDTKSNQILATKKLIISK
jgi:hypothetical protein